MRFRTKEHEDLVHARIRELEDIPGVHVTRRAVLWLGSSGALALLVGCGAKNDPGTATSDDDDDNDDDDDAATSAGDTTSPDDETLTSAGTSTDDTVSGTHTEDATSDDASSDPDASSETGETSHTSETSETPSDTSDETTTDSSPLTLQELMDLIHPDAKALVAQNNPDEIAFLEHIVTLMQRLEADLQDQQTNNYAIKGLLSDSPVEILQIDMAPGGQIPLHDHSDYIGALLGIKGSADCVNYTVTDGEVEDGYFLLQETARTALTPGVTGYLGLTLHNFHEVTAGNDGAQMLDVFVFFDPNGTSNWASIVEEVNAGEKIYKAKWGNYTDAGDPQRLLAR